jgi:hypothetical protein
MARILQHFTDLARPPVGVWWVDSEGEPQSEYIKGADAERIYARQVMALKYHKATWDEFFDALERIPPVISGWESVEVKIAPKEYLALVQDLKQVSV